MPTSPRDPVQLLLTSGLDPVRPFTRQEATRHGLDSRRLAALVDAGVLVQPLRSVYYAGHLAESLELRLACLRLVVPPSCVVTDRTAAWLHGAAAALAPNDHLRVPEINVFHSPGNRLRNQLTSSGERTLSERDITVLDGLRATTALRTACDLGRLTHRDSALASLDGLLRTELFNHEELLEEVDRFRGYRGVRQLRTLAPLADAGAESYGESALRLRWYDATVPVRPQTQIRLPRPFTHQFAYLDVGSEELRYAAEYDGERHHGEDRRVHDERRRRWIREECGWTVDVFRRADVFGRKQSADLQIRAGVHRAMLHIHAGSAG